jgi:hypothetical protein
MHDIKISFTETSDILKDINDRRLQHEMGIFPLSKLLENYTSFHILRDDR